MIHLKIPQIKGDGRTDGFLEAIDCSSFSWGAANTADANTPEGLTRATSSASQISLSAAVGKQTVNMLMAALISKHIPEATLHFTRTAGDNKVVEWMTLTLEKCVISSNNLSCSADDMGYESFSIAFEQFKMQYFLIDNEGNKTNGPELEYNITERKVVSNK
jgi:type VI secretion system secreted protein Hcp